MAVDRTPDAATLRAAAARGRESRLSPASTYCCLLLPLPPSANNLFAGKARRFVSTPYAAWRREAGHALMLQRPIPTFSGPVAVTYTCGRPDNRRRDLGNLEKATSDVLVSHGIISDDSMIEKITLQWGDVVGCRVEIEVRGNGGGARS